MVLQVVLPVTLAWLSAGVLHRYVYRSDPMSTAPSGSSFGKLRMTVHMPPIFADLPEPLIVCGRPGSATLVYIRFYENDLAKVGIEFWGMGAYESERFVLPRGDFNRVEIECSFPALFPAVGDAYWGDMSTELQTVLSSQYAITVDGVVRLRGRTSYQQPPHSQLYFGINPLGGSLVSNAFVGKILKVSQVESP